MEACQQNGMCLCQVTVMSAGLSGRLDCAVSGRVFCCNMQKDFSFISVGGSTTSYCWLPGGFCFNTSCGSYSSEQVWSNTLELHDKKRVAVWCFSFRIYSQSISLLFSLCSSFFKAIYMQLLRDQGSYCMLKGL